MKKAIPRKILLSLAVVMLATLVAAPMVLASPDPTADRTLPATSVTPGAQFDVDISASGCSFTGQVIETIPDGFTFIECTDPDIDHVGEAGQVVTFTFIAESADFTYTVQAPATAGTGTFEGVVQDINQVPVDVDGDTQVTVGTAATHTLTMAVSPAGGGTTNPAAGTHTYADGTLVTLTATANVGYQFSYWTGTNNNAINPTTVTMTADKSVTAYFVVSTTPQTFAWWLYETYIEPYM
jgi:hypothetical protein